MDARMLAKAAYDCCGDVYMDPRTGSRFDPKKAGYEMSDVAGMRESMPLSSPDTPARLTTLCSAWSVLFSDSQTYLHARNDGRRVAIGVSKTDAQMQFEKDLMAAFESGFDDAAKSARLAPKASPTTRDVSLIGARSVDELFSRQRSRDDGIGLG